MCTRPTLFIPPVGAWNTISTHCLFFQVPFFSLFRFFAGPEAADADYCGWLHTIRRVSENVGRDCPHGYSRGHCACSALRFRLELSIALPLVDIPTQAGICLLCEPSDATSLGTHGPGRVLPGLFLNDLAQLGCDGYIITEIPMPQEYNHSGSSRRSGLGKSGQNADMTAHDEGPRERSAAELAQTLMKIDVDLMKLLVRRTTMLKRLRGGKDHASGLQAVKAEKEVRSSWEKNAARFSRDPRFTRQLFSLLQEIQVSTAKEAETLRGFILSPQKKPLNLAMPGPVDLIGVYLCAALAAAQGRAMSFPGVVLGDALVNFVKTLNHCGAHFSWTGNWPEASRLHHAGGEGVSFPDKVCYAGDSLFSLHLLVFMAAGDTGKTRFTGGAGLKVADLTGLRRFMPVLGARLAHNLPQSKGLPAYLESSGNLPSRVTLPGDMDITTLLALLTAAATWPTAVAFDVSSVSPGFMDRVLGLLEPIFKDFGIAVSWRDNLFSVCRPAPSQEPEESETPCSAPDVHLSLDPVFNAYLLALPAFAGGRLSLRGTWPAQRSAAVRAEALLRGAHVAVSIDAESITADAENSSGKAFSYEDAACFHADLIPLAHAFTALSLLSGAAESLRAPVADREVAESFYERLGLEIDDAGFVRAAATPVGEGPWTSSSFWWTLAFALCAYCKRHLSLGNPGLVTEIAPSFWALYNALPAFQPEKRQPKQQESAAPRRRIRAS